MRRVFKVLLCGLFVVAAGHALAAGKIRVLIIDGQNNHDWKATTPILRDNLQKTGRFTVEVATTPPRGAPDAEWSRFRPVFTRYKVILSNYNGQDWPAEVRAAFEKYMAAGGGLVVFHAGNNPFRGWDEWNKMVGLSWQGPDFGDRITVGDNGETIRTPKGQGPGAGHGRQHPFTVTVRDADHPIMRGLPSQWTHIADELYHGQRGPAVNLHVLASAYSDASTGGTGANEPLVFTTTYGKGRTLVCLLGHAVPQAGAADTLLIVERGAEWAGTGRVTLPVPSDFPPRSAAAHSVRE